MQLDLNVLDPEKRRKAKEITALAEAEGRDPLSAVADVFPEAVVADTPDLAGPLSIDAGPIGGAAPTDDILPLADPAIDEPSGFPDPKTLDRGDGFYELLFPDGGRFEVPTYVGIEEADRLAKEQFPERFGIFPEVSVAPEPEKDAGFFSSLYGGLVRSVAGAPAGVQAVAGGALGNEELFEAAKTRAAAADEASRRASGRMTSPDDISKAYDEEGLVSAAAKFLELSTEGIGQSIGYLAPSLVSGAVLGRVGAAVGGMFGGPVGAGAGLGFGTLLGRGLSAFKAADRTSKAYKAAALSRTVGRSIGFTGTQVSNFLASNLNRSVEEARERGEEFTEDDYNVLKNLSIAGGQAALEKALVLLAGGSVVTGNITESLSSTGRRTLLASMGKAIDKIDDLGAVPRFVATMAEEQVAEIGQTALERLAAGEPISPFEEDAAREYVQTAISALGPSVFFGGVGAYSATRQKKKKLKSAAAIEEALGEIRETQKQIVEKAEEEKALEIEAAIEREEEFAVGRRAEFLERTLPQVSGVDRTIDNVVDLALDRNIDFEDELSLNSYVRRFFRRTTGKVKNVNELDANDIETLYRHIESMPIQEDVVKFSIASKDDAIDLVDQMLKDGKTTLTEKNVKSALESLNYLGTDPKRLTKKQVSDLVNSYRRRLLEFGFIDRKPETGVIPSSIDVDKYEQFRERVTRKPGEYSKDSVLNESEYENIVAFSLLENDGLFPTFSQLREKTGIRNLDYYVKAKEEALARGDFFEAEDGSVRVVEPETIGAGESLFQLVENISGQSPEVIGTFESEDDATSAKRAYEAEVSQTKRTGRGPVGLPELSVRRVRGTLGMNVRVNELGRPISQEVEGFEQEPVARFEYSTRPSQEFLVTSDNGDEVLFVYSTPAAASRKIRELREQGSKVDPKVSRGEVYRIYSSEVGSLSERRTIPVDAFGEFFLSKEEADQYVNELNKGDVLEPITPLESYLGEASGESLLPGDVDLSDLPKEYSDPKKFVDALREDPGLLAEVLYPFDRDRSRQINEILFSYDNENTLTREELEELDEGQFENVLLGVFKDDLDAEGRKFLRAELEVREGIKKAFLKELRKNRGLQNVILNIEGKRSQDDPAGTYNNIAGAINIFLDPIEIAMETEPYFDGSQSLDDVVDSYLNKRLPVLTHEIFHYAEGSGLVSASEKKLLLNAAKKLKVPDVVSSKYNLPAGELSLYEYVRELYKGEKAYPNQFDKDLDEEVLAFFAEAYYEDQSIVSGKPQNLFERIKDFGRKLVNFFVGNGFKTVEDVYPVLLGDGFAKRLAEGVIMDAPFNIRNPSDFTDKVYKRIVEASFPEFSRFAGAARYRLSRDAVQKLEETGFYDSLLNRDQPRRRSALETERILRLRRGESEADILADQNDRVARRNAEAVGRSQIDRAQSEDFLEEESPRLQISRRNFQRDKRLDGERRPEDLDKPMLPLFNDPPKKRDNNELLKSLTFGTLNFDSEGRYFASGKGIPVYVTAGATQTYGLRHAERHNKDIAANTPYLNAEEFINEFFLELKREPGRLNSGDIRMHFDPWSNKAKFFWNDSRFNVPGVVVLQYKDNAETYLTGGRYELITAYANTQYGYTTPDGSTASGPRTGRGADSRAVNDFFDNIEDDDGDRKAVRVSRPGVRTPVEQKAISAFMGPSGQRQPIGVKSMISSILDGLNHYDKPFWELFRYQTIDRYQGVFSNEKESIKKRRENGELGLTINEMAAMSAHSMMLLKDRAGSFVTAMLDYGTIDFVPLEGGDWMDGTVIVNDMELDNSAQDALVYNPESGQIERISYDRPNTYTGTGGLVKILQTIAGLNDSLLDKFYTYGRAVRAYNKINQGKAVPEEFKGENLNIALQFAYENPEIAIAHANLQKWNKSLVDFAVKTGVLNEKQAEIWLEYADYVPFYLDTDGVMEGDLREKFRQVLKSEDDFKMLGSMLPKPPSKKYRGLKQGPLVDPIEATVKNTMAILNESMKNVASNRFIRNMLVTGDAVRLDENSEVDSRIKHSVVTVYENGKSVRYKITDPFFHDTMVGAFDGESTVGAIANVLKVPADILREGVTRMPDFLLGNTQRDALLNWLVHGEGKVGLSPTSNPFSSMADSIVRVAKDSVARAEGGTATQQLLSKTGVVGGIELKDINEKTIKNRFDRRLRSATSVPNLFMRLWDALGDVGNFSESSARQRVFERTYDREYKRFLSQGKEAGLTGNDLTKYADTHAVGEAGFQAMEVLNYARRGNSPLLRFFTATVPFLNARIQGLDVFYRNAFAGENTLGIDPDVAKRALWRRGMMLAGVSTLYSLLHYDDDDFENVEEYRRFDNWLLPLGPLATKNQKYLAVPIPFEAGILFKIIPEQLTRISMGESTGEGLRAVAHSVTNTLAINPVPQGVRPMFETWGNKNFYTNQPIVPFYMEDLERLEQYSDSTSTISRAVAMILPEMPKPLDFMSLSPLQVENLMRGYVGSSYTYMNFVVDFMFNDPSFGLTERPSQLLTDKPFFRRFVVDNLGNGGSEDYYRLRDEVNQVVTTINKLKVRDPKRVAEYSKANADALKARSYVKIVDKELRRLTEASELIRRSNMDRDKKGDRLREIQAQRQRIFRAMPEVFGGRGK